MTKENAHLYLPLVQALAEGKTIQVNDLYLGWVDINNVTFSDSTDRYRIKPEPLEVEVWVTKDPSGNISSLSASSMTGAHGWIKTTATVQVP